jgi:FkbM family methyltransferase
MKTSLASRALNSALWHHLNSKSRESFCSRFQLLNRFIFKTTLNCGYDTTNKFYRITDNTGDTINIVNPAMIMRYKDGISTRLENLAKQYLSPLSEIHAGDVVIDIGANIGEFATYISANSHAFVVAIEPEQAVLPALRANLVNNNHLLLTHALWSHDTKLKLYHASKTNDTTLIEPPHYDSCETISVKALDKLAQSPQLRGTLQSGPIRLIKIEAEGAEPEIIKGGKETIARSEFVTVDCGPERGVRQDSTLIEVLAEMNAIGFVPVDFNPKRLVILFRNPSFSR